MALTTRVNDVLARAIGLELRRAGRARRPHASASAVRSGDGVLPPPRIPEHGAVSSDFFGRYPRFLETSRTAADRTRLNLRYEAIFAQNIEILDGARVLDLASHDGRWSFAALQSGVSDVVGIEGRPELVEHARSTFERYGVDRDRYDFVVGDIFETLADGPPQVDVVLCLGFLYHTLRYNELLSRIAQCDPTYVIFDTAVITQPGPFVRLQTERTSRERNAIDDQFAHDHVVLSGRPSTDALERMCDAYGFDVDRYSDWAALIRDNVGQAARHSVEQYARGDRITVRVRSRRRSPVG